MSNSTPIGSLIIDLDIRLKKLEELEARLKKGIRVPVVPDVAGAGGNSARASIAGPAASTPLSGGAGNPASGMGTSGAQTPLGGSTGSAMSGVNMPTTPLGATGGGRRRGGRRGGGIDPSGDEWMGVFESLAAPRAGRPPPLPKPGGGFGAPSLRNPHVLSTGMLMNFMFGGWEVSTAAAAVRRGNMTAALSSDPTSAMQAQLQGMQQATSGPIGGSLAEIGNMLGRVFPVYSMEKAERNTLNAIKQSESIESARTISRENARQRETFGLDPAGEAFSRLEIEHNRQRATEKLWTDIGNRRTAMSFGNAPSLDSRLVTVGTTAALLGPGAAYGAWKLSGRERQVDPLTQSAMQAEINAKMDQAGVEGERAEELNRLLDKQLDTKRQLFNVERNRYTLLNAGVSGGRAEVEAARQQFNIELANNSGLMSGSQFYAWSDAQEQRLNYMQRNVAFDEAAFRVGARGSIAANNLMAGNNRYAAQVMQIQTSQQQNEIAMRKEGYDPADISLANQGYASQIGAIRAQTIRESRMGAALAMGNSTATMQGLTDPFGANRTRIAAARGAALGGIDPSSPGAMMQAVGINAQAAADLSANSVERNRFLDRLKGDVAESGLRANRRPRQAGLLNIANSAMENAAAFSGDPSVANQMLRIGQNEITGALGEITKSFRAGEASPFSAFGGGIDNSTESLVELQKAANELLSKIEQKISTGATN